LRGDAGEDDSDDSDEEDEDWSLDLEARLSVHHPKVGRGQSSFVRQQLMLLGYKDKLDDNAVVGTTTLARAETFSPGRVLLDHPEAQE